MGLFNRKKENAIQINDVSSNVHYSPFVFTHKKGERPVANVYLQVILNKLFSGISNVSFEVTKNNLLGEDICKFIDNNAPLLIHQYIRLGFICIFYNDRKEYFIPKDQDIRKDSNGRVINRSAVVYYSHTYTTERKSLYMTIAPIMLTINKLSGTYDYLNDTLGCFGILSGSDIPLNPEGKKRMLDGMKDNYGTASEKYQFMLANNDMKYTNISPDIKGLQLQERLEDQYKLLCNYFGVPLPLIFEKARTFNNVREAKVFFYDTTIREYAEILLKVARELLTATGEFVPQNTITYRITNVPELESTLSSAVDQRKTFLSYLLELKTAGIDVDKEINLLAEESKDLLYKV